MKMITAVVRPFKLDELRIFLGRALEEYRLRHEASALRKTLKQRFSATNLIGDTPAMRAVIDIIERVADADVPVEMQQYVGLNAELAKDWPEIVRMEDPLPEAALWATVKDKLGLLKRA